MLQLVPTNYINKFRLFSKIKKKYRKRNWFKGFVGVNFYFNFNILKWRVCFSTVPLNLWLIQKYNLRKSYFFTLYLEAVLFYNLLSWNKYLHSIVWNPFWHKLFGFSRYRQLSWVHKLQFFDNSKTIWEINTQSSLVSVLLI